MGSHIHKSLNPDSPHAHVYLLLCTHSTQLFYSSHTQVLRGNSSTEFAEKYHQAPYFHINSGLITTSLQNVKAVEWTATRTTTWINASWWTAVNWNSWFHLLTDTKLKGTWIANPCRIIDCNIPDPQDSLPAAGCFGHRYYRPQLAQTAVGKITQIKNHSKRWVEALAISPPQLLVDEASSRENSTICCKGFAVYIRPSDSKQLRNDNSMENLSMTNPLALAARQEQRWKPSRLDFWNPPCSSPSRVSGHRSLEPMYASNLLISDNQTKIVRVRQKRIKFVKQKRSPIKVNQKDCWSLHLKWFTHLDNAFIL